MSGMTHNRYNVVDTTNTTPSARCLLPRARLCVDGDRVMASVPELADAPLPLPRVPATLLQHLLTLAVDFGRAHGRCLAILLLLDLRRMAWDYIVPWQVAGVDEVRWRLDGPELAALPDGYALAGSFQLHPGQKTEELRLGVPPIDGIHFLEPLAPVEPVEIDRVSCTFVCAGGTVTAVPLPYVVVDDFARDQAMFIERVTLI